MFFSFLVPRAKGYKCLFQQLGSLKVHRFSANNETNAAIFWLFLPSAAALCLLSSCCCFFAKSPLSSPLLCFVDDEIIQVHTLYGIQADDQELVRNLATLSVTLTLHSPLFFVMMH